MKIEILYSFGNEECRVYETKRLDLPENAPKSERFQWYFLSRADNTPLPLRFLSMGKDQEGNEIRIFEQGELRFSKESATFLSKQREGVPKIYFLKLESKR